jgi:hypothetical protein
MWQVFRVVRDYEDRREYPVEGEIYADEKEAASRCDELESNSCWPDYFVIRKVDI